MTVLDHVPPQHLDDLAALFRSAWWLTDRTSAETELVLRESDLIVALVDDDRLAGFARVLTDYAHVALVLDVVVSPDTRGAGHGATLMETIVTHPSLQQVRSIELVCQPELVPFYSRWGFTDEVGQSLLMRRSVRSSAASSYRS
ncbi:N-acetyltransferase [Kribbella antibiotica]|uniref:N-acetyltransferase n=1 Tax=Kribbella antibiotica TaxID=190195 RepID=A0A4V2YKZ6_9ACTN|nr:GNAT family N-acetyltransferase [Kribbella antibiotica]TDD44387.1 N-acetyltransferase [Kribbella antibiotica]